MTTDLAIRDEQHYLATVAEVRALAERIESVGNAKALADKARAAQVWAERARIGDQQINLAAVAKLWAERRAGELLRETPGLGSRGGDRRSETSTGALLDDLGVTKHESSRWQQLAEISAEKFEQALNAAAENGRVTATAVRNLAVELSDEYLEEQQRKANVQHLSNCVRGLEVSPGHARTEIRRLISGDHPFTPERFERAAEAATAYAEALREEGVNGQV